MTPTEKAIDLRDKFHKNCNATIAGTSTIFRQMSKGLALIAVEEIREVLKKQYNKIFSESHREVWGEWEERNDAEYWESVKQEIQKL